jgi:phage tail protein X
MFARVVDFGRTNLGDTGDTDASQHLGNLARIIAALGQAKAGQNGGSAEAKDVLIDALRIDLHNVTRTANALAQDDPGFAKLFRAPGHPNAGEVLTAADAVIANLVEMPNDDGPAKATKGRRRALFVTKGLPAEFAQHLVDDRTAIDAAKASENQGDSEGVKNTALIGRLVAEGLKESTYLDAIFHNLYTRNPEKLRAWLSASHVERAAKRAKKNEEPAVPESELTEPAPVATK